MTPAVTPWTVVSHTADDSVPATSVARLMAWLDQQPEVELYTALWATGHYGTAPYDFGRLANIGRAHEVLPARVLRAFGQPRLAGGVAGRAVRATVRTLPPRGVLYLSSARAGAVLRYLPPGGHTVVTHLHEVDRRANPPLPADRVATLIERTDVWLAVDDETQEWAVAEWGIEEHRIHVLPDIVDPATLPDVTGVAPADGSRRSTDPNQLRLVLRGATWFGRDHTPRLVQHLLRQRPSLALELVWAEVTDRKHLGPVLHDLRQLDVLDRLEVPASRDALQEALKGIDAVALTTPDEDAGWLLSHGTATATPMVCFDSHRGAPAVAAAGGVVVPYLAVAEMAGAVLALVDERRASRSRTIESQRTELARRGPDTVGRRLLEIVGSVVVS